MHASAFLAVGVGAVFGAWLRWGFTTWLNPLAPNLPLGTLTANVVGGYLVGLAVTFFGGQASSLPPEWRLACITGFLGALTTFSTFSAESLALIESGRVASAAVHSVAHLFGALVATALGVATARSLGW
jgi:CrcB protein